MPEQKLVKLKTGTIAKIMNENQNGTPTVPLEEGSIYFAYDVDNEKGKILYDVSNNLRIVMGTDVEYADEAGLAYDAEKLETARTIDGVNFNGTVGITHYGSCTTAAATATKQVSCDNFILGTGARITVKFSNTNTASAPKLKVGNTEAKSIYHRGAPIEARALAQNGTYEFIYDGTYWQYVGTIAVNTGITIDDNSYTMFITSPIMSGDGVSY